MHAALPSYGAAASVLLAPLLTGDASALREAARTRLAVHYETELPGLPDVCVATHTAVRLPHAVVVDTLPGADLVVERSCLTDGSRRWRVSRWWSPSRPRVVGALRTPAPDDWMVVDGLDRDAVVSLVVDRLLGGGPGLTPAGDDVLAGALVAAWATNDPMADELRVVTRRRLTPGRTTAVSRGMLTAAWDGYCCPELAAYIADPVTAERGLLAVGHSSGRALRAGVWAVLSRRSAREEAA